MAISAFPSDLSGLTALPSTVRRLVVVAAKVAFGLARSLLFRPQTIDALPNPAPPRTILPEPLDVPLSAQIPGQPQIVDYRNDLTSDPVHDCGQAALATVGAFWGLGVAAEMAGASCAAALSDKYPPDMLGTSPPRQDEMLRSEGLGGGGWTSSDEQLRAALDAGLPAVTGVCLKPITGEWNWHWVVAYGYDAENVYVSNWGDNRMTWDEFRGGRDHWTMRLLHTAGRSLVRFPEAKVAALAAEARGLG